MIKDFTEEKELTIETLDSYINKDNNYTISHRALFTGFQQRSKVEFLRFFIV